MFIPRRLAALLPLRSLDGTRGVLGCVRLERGEDGKARAIVTDGKRLAVHRWDEPAAGYYPDVGLSQDAVPGAAANVPGSDLKRICDIVPRKAPRPDLGYALLAENWNGKATAIATDLEKTDRVEFTPDTAPYPDYGVISRDLASKPPKVTFCLNAKLLAEALEAVCRLHPDRDRIGATVAVEVRGSDRPVRFVAESDGARTDLWVMPVLSTK